MTKTTYELAFIQGNGRFCGKRIKILQEKKYIIAGVCHDKDSGTSKQFRDAFCPPYQENPCRDMQDIGHCTKNISKRIEEAKRDHPQLNGLEDKIKKFFKKIVQTEKLEGKIRELESRNQLLQDRLVSELTKKNKDIEKLESDLKKAVEEIQRQIENYKNEMKGFESQAREMEKKAKQWERKLKEEWEEERRKASTRENCGHQ